MCIRDRLITHAQNETTRKAEEYGFDYNIVTCADSTAQVNALETMAVEDYDLIPVSYTHLRRMRMPLKMNVATAMATSTNKTPMPAPATAPSERIRYGFGSVSPPRKISTAAVSYTHLDVYKRQQPQRP